MALHLQTDLHRRLDHGLPRAGVADEIRDEQLYYRAVEAYKFFYPTVSAEGIFNGGRELGIEDGKGLMALSARPHHLVFTANSDTPYATGVLDLRAMGPVMIEMPAGPYIGLVDDHHQRWVVDLGIPGVDGGNGGSYLVLPPRYQGPVPSTCVVARARTFKVLLALRALPIDGDVVGAMQALQRVRVRPLSEPSRALPFYDVTDRAIDATPLRWERGVEYFKRLHDVLQVECFDEEAGAMYGELSALGIEKGKPFAPDRRTRAILERAAGIALDQMLVEGFASKRPDRVIWSNRRWEWVGLTTEDPGFVVDDVVDLEARERWFVQAIVASPAMFRRRAGSGSIYFLAARDASGAYLDGGTHFKLSIPAPVPAKMFWSLTAYDTETRSQVIARQGKAVLGSLVDQLSPNEDGAIELFFGPTPPKGREASWIQTAPGRSFFLYFRIYGPEVAALDGSWRPGDLERIDSSVECPGPADRAPPSITTPESCSTRIGTLAFPLGMPTEETASRVYDLIDIAHGIEAFQNALPLVSTYAIRKALLEAGVRDNEVLLFSGLMDSSSLFLTGNCDTVNFFSFLDLSRGPVVLDVPPNVLGVLDDMGSGWVCDVGSPGPDRGQGGRYLIVPDAYAGPLPEGGYFVARCATERAFLLGRAFLENGRPEGAAERIRSSLRISPYVAGGRGTSIAQFLQGDVPLSPPLSAPPIRVVEGTGLAINTIPPNDISFFEMLDAAIQDERQEAIDPEIYGQLAALGIAKGTPFRPDARLSRLLGEAAALGNAAARTIALRPRDAEGFRYYGAASQWENPLFVGGYEFSTPPPIVSGDGVHPFPDRRARTLHSRTAFFYLAFGVTPAMCMRLTGIGSQYVGTFFDAAGEPLDGEKCYSVTLPPEIPASMFWSLTVYDNQTRSMLQTPQRFPRAGSQSFPTAAAIAAPDGATTVHFGPSRPDGVPEGNWIQTAPGKGWFVLLRLYGPLAPFFDRTWRPGEVTRKV
jgi:hypothetical protein